MKQIFTWLLFAAAFTACSDEKESTGPSGKDIVISFETSDGLLDNQGVAVALGDAEVWNGETTVTHSDIFWAKESAEEGRYDGVLFTTAEGDVGYGSYYLFDAQWGDAWGGFVLSANYTQTPVSDGDFSHQFAAWTHKGANGSATCLIGYDGSYTDGPQYALPTIEFDAPRVVKSVSLANTSVTYCYTPVNVDVADYYYKIAIIGWVGEQQAGRVECVLVKGMTRVADWKRVDISSLGEVDRLTFKPETNDANNWGPIAPGYFALDELCLRAGN